MAGRDPHEKGRSSTPLELLYDLTYVIAFATAAEQLAHFVGTGESWPALGAYLFAIFSITWAWMNFTWFASAYGNDDALVRVATIVQMIGVVILTFGLPVSFEAAEAGRSPNNALMVVGYVVMRVPLVGLWLFAARQDHAHRPIDIAYAVTISVAQAGWVLTAIVSPPLIASVALLAALAIGEMAAPVILERRLGNAPWNAGHIAERFSLLTLITLGEVVAATTSAVTALTEEHGWSLAAAVIASSGLVLAAGLWWAYFLIPSRTILERRPERVWIWRYAHLPMFGAIAAVGAGLRVAASAVSEGTPPLIDVTAALVLPVAAVLVMIFATWSVLMRSFDLTHAPLLIISSVPLVAAMVVALTSSHKHLDLTKSSTVVAMVSVIALVALSVVIEVVGHELVGYRHTVDALEQQHE
jgi:low temperature requirement protein LtrA